MYLIAGLGNPGREYDMTRHNIGFEVIDYIADKYKIKVKFCDRIFYRLFSFSFYLLCKICSLYYYTLFTKKINYSALYPSRQITNSE